MSYSQHGEEETILRWFGDRVGRFLDIGAFNGFSFSNTLALVERGWSGVLVEGSPRAFLTLLDRHGANERLTLLHAVVLPDNVSPPPIVLWHECADSLSTTDAAHRDKWAAGAHVPYRSCLTGAIYLGDLFQSPLTAGPFDFISIDTEGTSAMLFRSLARHREHLPELLCVEHDGCLDEISYALAPLGYERVYLDGNNLIMGRPR